MPRGDGTGPVGQRNNVGRGFGRGLGRGVGGQLSPENCVCPKCGYKEPHIRGQPCFKKQCPECGTAMTRE